MTAGGETSAVPDCYAFEVAIHRRPAAAVVGATFADSHGRWPTLELPRESLGEPLAVGFDQAFDQFAGLPRMFVEPDGAFVWVGSGGKRPWQVDGNLFERDGRVLLVEAKGACPPAEFDRILAACGWPAEPLIFQLLRAGTFLDEAAFRRHAATRGAAGDGQTLRPA
jgi:hypothetical protein